MICTTRYLGVSSNWRICPDQVRTLLSLSGRFWLLEEKGPGRRCAIRPTPSALPRPKIRNRADIGEPQKCKALFEELLGIFHHPFPYSSLSISYWYFFLALSFVHDCRSFYKFLLHFLRLNGTQASRQFGLTCIPGHSRKTFLRNILPPTFEVVYTVIRYSNNDIIVIQWNIQVRDEELFLLEFPTHASPESRSGEVDVPNENQEVRFPPPPQIPSLLFRTCQTDISISDHRIMRMRDLCRGSTRLSCQGHNRYYRESVGTSQYGNPVGWQRACSSSTKWCSRYPCTTFHRGWN